MMYESPDKTVLCITNDNNCFVVYNASLPKDGIKSTGPTTSWLFFYLKPEDE